MRCLVAFFCFSVSLCAADAVEWLDNMGAALREQNYVGTFTYMRGSLLETVRVEHQFHNGQELERLTNLNGEPRIVIRRDNDIVCHHLNPKGGSFNHNISLGPFSAAFNENLATNHKQYLFSMHGKDRIAGRTAIKIKIIPRFGDRFGYRLWLDEETGLLLQSQLFKRNQILEVFQFSSIEIGQALDLENSSLVKKKTVFHRLTADPHLNQQVGNPAWRVSWLPTGFKPVRVQQANQLHFSDGLAGLSIFFERKRSTLPEMTTYLGATAVITRRLNGTQGQITVVGEVPINIARKIAESVERIAY
ncbi:MAG: MucB/RseB C-terminal domain-containing protein [Candidatus Azotimanducaceae bacterium]|uniref:Transcriptional regulator n=1 Tax=OM182 bacterium TaxID=2510334 RepID=A0A520S1H2_9GAMM|nr:hypothetical protein [Gammaproteobacteria bacterium]RZO76317.1 MAG: hypothetical protein EVA68_04490 [OM182 bacterium]